MSPELVADIVPWRGLSPFGYDRTWSEIAYPEAVGLAKEAIRRQPSDPVDYICETFGLKRRVATTLGVFQGWVTAATGDE